MMEKQHQPKANAPTPVNAGSTRQSPAEALAEQRLRELEEERRQRDQFVSLVSHELRGPLAALIGYAQLLARADATAPELREKATQSILAQSKRINQMVENLLQASRLTSGRFRMERQPTNLLPLVRQVVAQQRDLAPHHHLVLNTPDVTIVGDWDANLLGLALANLLSNAVKFSPDGGEVDVSVQRTRSAALVTITDRGIGIAPADLPTLFQPYRRPARTERYPGMGVGLYVAKGIVEAHGGQIGVDSQPERGSTFWLTLPLPE